MNRRIIAIACGTSLLIAAAVVVALRERQSVPLPEVPAEQTSAEVRVKAVERKGETVERENVTASDAVAIVCGMDEATAASDAVAIVCGEDAATADRYEARNDALRSIARRRDLAKNDVDALLAYLRSADDAMRVERVAALKNDVMNLLRNQDPPPVEGLAETLIAMIEGGNSDCGGVRGAPALPANTVHPPVVVDYCIQHLGAMLDELDEKGRLRVLAVLVKAAKRTKQPYAGTALYSLAEDKRATAAQEGELKRLTLALCKPGVNNVARIAAIQLAGQRGYAEALPVLRETLSGEKRDAVLDTVCIGSIGLLGNADDIALIERFKGDARRAAAVEAAIKRIKGREDIGTPTAGKEASLTLRPVLRAVQPHEIRSDSLGGLGAVPPDKENIVGGNNRGFATRS